MSEEQIIEFLTQNIDYFVNNDYVISILRTIGWLLVKGMNTVIDSCKKLYDITFGLIDITRYTGLEEFIAENEVLVNAILVLSITILGYLFILGKEKKYDFLLNLLIFAVVFTSSGYLFATLNSFTVMFKDGVISGSGTVDGYELVNQNLYDLRYIDEQIGMANMSGTEELPRYPSLDETDLRMIKIAETLPDDAEGLTEEAKDILGKFLIYSNAGNRLSDVEDGLAWTDFGNTYYYRYQFHFGSYYLSAIATMVVFLGLSYKNMRIIWELITSRVLVMLFSGDISSRKKTVRLLEAIRDGYYALCFTAVTLRLYFLFMEYINAQQDLGGLTRGILLLFVAFCVIDGANIMEKLSGVDAGLTSMTSRLMGGAHMLQGAAQMGMQMRQLHLLRQKNKDTPSGNGSGGPGGTPGGKSSFPEGKEGSSQTSGDGSSPAGTDADAKETGGKERSSGSSSSQETENGQTSENSQMPEHMETAKSHDSGEEGSNASPAEEAFGDTGAHQEGANESAAEKNFAAMDAELSGGTKGSVYDTTQPDPKAAGTNPNQRNIPTGGAAFGEKGMFERREEKRVRQTERSAAGGSPDKAQSGTTEKSKKPSYQAGDGGGERGFFR